MSEDINRKDLWKIQIIYFLILCLCCSFEASSFPFFISLFNMHLLVIFTYFLCMCWLTNLNLNFLYNQSWFQFRDAFSRSPCALVQPSMKAAAENLAIPDFGINNSRLYITKILLF